MTFVSQSKAIEEKHLEGVNADMQIMVGWIEDTLRPSYDILKVKTGLMSLLKDVLDFEKKTGVTEKSSDRKLFLHSLIESSTRIDNIATQNNSFQLLVKYTVEESKSLRSEINTLKTQIENLNREL